jgi:hypothetical protein
MPAADLLIISKSNQEQDEGICSLSEDGPCSLPTVRMISSGSLSSISHPLSALPLQFQADPEDDDYTREAKEQAAWKAAAVMDGDRSGGGILRIFGHECSAPIGETTPLPDRGRPGREGKISAQASDLETPTLLLLTNGDPQVMQYSAANTPIAAGLESPPQDFDQATRRRPSRFQSGVNPTAPLANFGGGNLPPTLDVPICQRLADFRASLHQRMQSIFLNPFHATLRPGLQGDTSTALIALLIGLEKTLQPLYPHGGAPSSDLHSPQPQSPALSTASPGVLSPGVLSWGPLPFACSSTSQLGEGSRAQLSLGGPPPNHLLADPTNAWSPVTPHNRRERKQRVGMGPVVAPSTLSVNRGPMPLAGPRWSNGRSSPPEKKSGAVAGGTTFVQDLRAARLTQQTRRAPVDLRGRETKRSHSFMWSVQIPLRQRARNSKQRSATCCCLFRRRGLPLDILPMNATKQGGDFYPGSPASDLARSTADVCPDGSISIDVEGLSQASRSLSEQLLPGLPASNLAGHPRQELAVRSPGIYPDGCIHALPPPTKYKDILRMVEVDLKALQDPPAAPREA